MEVYSRSQSLTFNSGDVFRMFLRENKLTNNVLARAGKSKGLDSLPLLVVTATEQYKESQKNRYRKEGIDPEKEVKLWFDMQKELKELSSNGKQIVMNASHSSIITNKANADAVNKEILLFAENIEKKN